MGAGVSDGTADELTFMAAKVIEDDDVADPQHRDKEVDDPREEGLAVDRPVDDAGSDDTVDAQSGQKCHCGPATMGNAPDQTLTARRAPMGAGHVGLGPSLIDKNQARGINSPLIAPPTGALASDVGSLLLGGA